MCPAQAPTEAASTTFGITRGNRTTDDVVPVSIYVCTHISHHQLYAMSFSRVKKKKCGDELQDSLIGSKSLAKRALYKWDAAVCPRTVVLGMPCVCLQPRIRRSFPQIANKQSLLRPHAILSKEKGRRTHRPQRLSSRQQMCGASTIIAAAQHVLCGCLVQWLFARVPSLRVCTRGCTEC